MAVRSFSLWVLRTRSLSLGFRYDLGTSHAIKAQLERQFDKDDSAPALGRQTTFYREIAGKTLPQINSYWTTLIFTGKGKPPRSIDETDGTAGQRPPCDYLSAAGADRQGDQGVVRLPLISA